MLNREILAKPNVVKKEIKAANDFAYFKKFNAMDRYTVLKLFASENESEAINATAVLLQKTLCDEFGNLIYTENEWDLINSIEAELMDELAITALNVNGIGQKAEKEAIKN